MPKTKRREQKQLTRQKIVNTACRLYATTGFSTPTSLIAQQAQVSHGTIFVHFPTREDLQLRVLEQFAREVGQKLHNLSAAGGDVTQLLCAHLGVLEEYEPFYKTLISEISSLPKEARAVFVSLQSTISLHFGVVTQRAKEKGEIKDIPLHMLFHTWIGLLHHYLQNSDLFAPGTSVLKSRKDELVNTFVTLIST